MAGLIRERGKTLKEVTVHLVCRLTTDLAQRRRDAEEDRKSVCQRFSVFARKKYDKTGGYYRKSWIVPEKV